MKKVLVCVAAVAFFAVALSLVFGPSAEARPGYNKAFEGKYVKEGSEIHKALGGKSNCNVCHDGADKKKRNDFGKTLGKALDGKDIKDEKKIDEALEKAAKEPSKADDKKSPTFGELIEKGTLPITK